MTNQNDTPMGSPPSSIGYSFEELMPYAESLHWIYPRQLRAIPIRQCSRVMYIDGKGISQTHLPTVTMSGKSGHSNNAKQDIGSAVLVG